MSHFTIGHTLDGNQAVQMDLATLVATRGLICANSGGGKSWLLRLIAERAGKRVQTLILDPEGEYATLREKLDLALVGRDGEIAVDTRTASKLARKLVEANVSAVIDLYDLDSLDAKRKYVRLFLEALMALPRALWHPLLLIIDEAHKFAAEGAKSESVAAVVNVMDSGRKRGIGTLLATQRISKTNKDALAEAKNVFIGNTVLDLDQERAGDMLGLAKADRLKLRDLDAGVFYAFGPALGKGLFVIKSDKVETRHPKPGEAHLVEVPKASAHISSIVTQIGDLPAQVQEEVSALEAARREAAQLRQQLAQRERQLNARPVASANPEPRVEAKIEIVEKPVLNGEVKQFVESANALRATMEIFPQRLQETLTPAMQPVVESLRLVLGKVEQVQAWTPPASVTARQLSRVPAARPAQTVSAEKARDAGDAVLLAGERLGLGESKILTAVAQYADGATREQLTILTGYKRSSRDTYIQRLAQRGFVIVQGARVMATDAGVAALGSDFEPLPTGAALREYWLARLTGGEKAVLEVALRFYPNAVERTTIDELTGYKRSSRDSYIQRLQARRLVMAERSVAGQPTIRASDELFLVTYG